MRAHAGIHLVEDVWQRVAALRCAESETLGLSPAAFHALCETADSPAPLDLPALYRHCNAIADATRSVYLRAVGGLRREIASARAAHNPEANDLLESYENLRVCLREKPGPGGERRPTALLISALDNAFGHLFNLLKVAPVRLLQDLPAPPTEAQLHSLNASIFHRLGELAARPLLVFSAVTASVTSAPSSCGDLLRDLRRAPFDPEKFRIEIGPDDSLELCYKPQIFGWAATQALEEVPSFTQCLALHARFKNTSVFNDFSAWGEMLTARLYVPAALRISPSPVASS